MAIFASFACYIFGTFTFKATIIILYYVAPSWLFIDAETDDLEWSFCVKIWSKLGIQWTGVLAFGENYSEICRATHITVSAAQQKCSPATVLVISVMGLLTGVTRRGSVKPVDCIHTHSSHTCCSLMPVENK